MPDYFFKPYHVYALREGAPPAGYLYALIITAPRYAERPEVQSLSVLFLSEQFPTVGGVDNRLPVAPYTREKARFPENLIVATDVIFPMPHYFFEADMGPVSPQDKEAVKQKVREWLDL